MTRRMRYASVCSGVEAASLAWMPLGWETAWFSEIEPFPCEVLRQRFPSVPNLGDMTLININEKGDIIYGAASTAILNDGRPIDLIVGGTPCQDASVAGKRAGLVEGSRSKLAFTFTRLAYELAARRGLRWVVWENVPGVFSLNGGRDFAAFLSSLCGRDVAVPERGGWGNFGVVRPATSGNFGLCWRVLDVQYARVDGFPRAIPQRRRRVFLVGHLGSWERAAAVLFESKSQTGDTPPERNQGQGAPRHPEEGAGESRCYNINSDGSNAMRSPNPHSGIYEAGATRTLDALVPTPQKNQGGTMIVSNSNGGDVMPTLCAEDLVKQKTNEQDRGGGYIVEQNWGIGKGQVAELAISMKKCSQTLDAMHDAHKVVTVRMREGCEGGGKGPLVSEGKSLTLGTGNDQVVCTVDMMGSKGNAVVGDGQVSPVIATTHNDVHAICFQQNTRDEVREMNGDGQIAGALSAESGMKQQNYLATTGGGNLSLVVAALDGDKLGKKERRGGSDLGIHTEDVSYTCTAKDVHGVALLENCVCYPINSMVLGKDIREGDRQTTGIGQENDPCPTLQVGHYHAVAQCQPLSESVAVDLYNQSITGDVAMTVGSSASDPHHIPFAVEKEATYSVRRLLPLETERLMGFPDFWTRIPWRGKPAEECPDAPRYKACGNSMGVNCMRWIGLGIEAVVNRCKENDND